MLITHEDVLKELSKRTGKPYEQLRVMYVDFYHQIKQNLMNPENNFTKGILLRNCIKFRLNPKEVAKTYRNIMRFNKETQFAQKTIEYFNLLNDKNELTEKQKELIKEFQGSELHQEGREDPNDISK